MVEVASSVSLEGVVADEFNADEDMKDAFAQSIIDSSDGVFDDVVDVEAVVRRRRLQAEYPPSPALMREADRTRRLQTEYPPSPAPTREADRTLAPTRAAAGLADVSYTGVARVDGTEDAEAVSTDLLEKAAAALTTAVDDGSFLTKLRTNAAERSPEAAAAFNAITVDETATRAHIGRASRVFVVTTPEPTAAPTPRPLSPPTPKPTPAPTPRPSLTMSPVSLVSGGGSGSGSGAAGPDAATAGGAAAGALVLLLAAAGAFFFYRRNTAAKKSQDVEANANGVCDETGGLEAPPQTAAITSKVDEPPPPPAPGLLARALSRRGSDAAAAAPPPAPAAVPTTTARGKKAGPLRGDSKGGQQDPHGLRADGRLVPRSCARRAAPAARQFPPTPDAPQIGRSAPTTAFLDDQDVARQARPQRRPRSPGAAAPPAAAPAPAPQAPPAPAARGWFGWGAGGDPASPSQPLEGVLVTPPTALPVTASVVASSVSRAAAPPRNFCPSCGNRLADGANFCMACGRSVSS